MKTNNLLIKLILLGSFFIFGWSADKGVTPSTIEAGETTKIYLNTNGDLPSGYDVRFSLNSSSNVTKLNGGMQNWYFIINSSVNSPTGVFTVHFKLYKDGYFDRDLGDSTLTITPKTPSAPSSVDASDGTYSDKIKINWSNVGATEYRIYRNGSLIKTTSSTYYDDNTANEGISYTYKIKACNTTGCSDYSLSDTGYKETVDNQPNLVINTSGSSSSNNPKESNFDISISASDDKGLNGLAYVVYTSSGTATGQQDGINISGTSTTKNISIDVNSLEIGHYKVAIQVSDSIGQRSIKKWYWFQKVQPENNIDEFKLSFSQSNSFVANILNTTNSNTSITRGEASILLEKFLSWKSNTFKNKNIDKYFNTFADVDYNSDYFNSLLKLSYYMGDQNDRTVITKQNKLFRPFDKVSREEFVAMVIEGLDLFIQDDRYYLGDFTDLSDASNWAIKYFNTAVKNGLINGNRTNPDNPRLLPRDKLTVYEALVILSNVEKKFEGNYLHHEANFENTERINKNNLFHKQIGNEYEPRYYESNATPISISNVIQSNAINNECGENLNNAVVLEVLSTTDNNYSSKITDYYWWNSNYGYFKKHPENNNYKKVCFIPATTKPNKDYKIVVQGGDNIGYVDKYLHTIPLYSFNYTIIDEVSNTTNNISFNSESSLLIANEPFTINIDGGFKKGNINLGIEHVIVNLIGSNDKVLLFKGSAKNNKITFITPDLPELYGQTLNYEVVVNTQNNTYSNTKNIKYVPKFIINGKVYNSNNTYKANYVNIGNEKVYLNENNEFYKEISSSNEISNINISIDTIDISNSFNSQTISLSYDTPKKHLVFVGKDKTNKDLDDTDSLNKVQNENFEKNGDVVYDTTTTLSWSDKSYTKSSFTFYEANEYCENLVINEFDDWRLPSSKELATIIEFGLNENRTLNEIFENHPVYLWTSTQYSKDTTKAMYYDMWNGQSYFGSKDTSNAGINLNKKAKCVRGQNNIESVNFTKNTNQKITIDNTRNLIWEDREFSGQTWSYSGETTVHFAVDAVEYRTWGEARDYCQNLTYANQTNWRLPTIQELYSIIDENTNSVIGTFEHIYEGHYWSSTLDKKTAGAFRMDLQEGSNGVVAITSDNKEYGYGGGSRFVKCVATKSDTQIDTIPLNKGWNLISIPFDTTIDIDNLNNGDISTIYSYQNNIWKVWTKKEIEPSYNQLLNLEDSYGYWVFTTNETNIDVAVRSNPSTRQVISNTWNLQGSRQINDFDNFFNSTGTSIIWKFKDGKYKAISKNDQTNNKLISNDISLINSIEKHEGFWIK